MRRLEDEYRSSWRRIMLLILAVTVHNIPEVNYRCSIAFTISYWLSVYQLSLGTRRWCRIRLCGKDRSSQVRNSFQSGNRNWSSELPRRASGFTATGCLWSFQTEGEHTSVSKKKIVKRMIKAYTPHRWDSSKFQYRPCLEPLRFATQIEVFSGYKESSASNFIIYSFVYTDQHFAVITYGPAYSLQRI